MKFAPITLDLNFGTGTGKVDAIDVFGGEPVGDTRMQFRISQATIDTIADLIAEEIAAKMEEIASDVNFAE